MSPRAPLGVTILAVFFQECFGHGWMTAPVSRNELANKLRFAEGGKFRTEPQSSAGGNSCGISDAVYLEGPSTWKKWYDADRGLAMATLTPGADIEFQARITADHGGQAWMMVSCADRISEEASWRLLSRSQRDRGHHILPGSPATYVWGVGQSGGTLHASFHVPAEFACPNSYGVGRWVWKTGNSCIDANNVGIKTEPFSFEEYKSVAPTAVGRCFGPPETFISCFDFRLMRATPTVMPTAGSIAPSPPPTNAPTPAGPSTRVPTSMPTMLPPTRIPTAMPSMLLPTVAPTDSLPTCTITETGPAQLATDDKCQAACRLLPQGLWPCGGGNHPCVCDTAMPTHRPSPVPTPMPTLVPSSKPTNTPTQQPTTPLPTSIPPISDCVDYAGKVCHACLASNNVCYTESQGWCDTWPLYRWCGVSRRLFSVSISDSVML